jgi:hypothetical protein
MIENEDGSDQAEKDVELQKVLDLAHTREPANAFTARIRGHTGNDHQRADYTATVSHDACRFQLVIEWVEWPIPNGGPVIVESVYPDCEHSQRPDKEQKQNEERMHTPEHFLS